MSGRMRTEVNRADGYNHNHHHSSVMIHDRQFQKKVKYKIESIDTFSCLSLDRYCRSTVVRFHRAYPIDWHTQTGRIRTAIASIAQEGKLIGYLLPTPIYLSWNKSWSDNVFEEIAC
jgi:hypothetical protein